MLSSPLHTDQAPARVMLSPQVTSQLWQFGAPSSPPGWGFPSGLTPGCTHPPAPLSKTQRAAPTSPYRPHPSTGTRSGPGRASSSTASPTAPPARSPRPGPAEPPLPAPRRPRGREPWRGPGPAACPGPNPNLCPTPWPCPAQAAPCPPWRR